MDLQVCDGPGGHVLVGPGEDVALANRFLQHLSTRCFAPATRCAYAFDLLSFLRFCAERRLALATVQPMEVFDFLGWLQRSSLGSADRVVIPLQAARGVAPATMNRRIAALRGLFEFAVVAGVRSSSPVPTARTSSSVRARRGLLGHLRSPNRGVGQGRLVRQPRRLPESLPAHEVAAFIADLGTARDRAMALLMLLGGLRSCEVRGLLLRDVDMGLRRVLVLGKGGKERVVPVDRAFFTELACYMRTERPPGCATEECFVVLRGPTRGGPVTEAGLRHVFRIHRDRAGVPRVRPHRLRHTYGTQLASAGIDLVVLRDLMGHASPETTAGYIHLSVETLAADYAKARLALSAGPS
jgi:site-specific recombinase XerD